MPKSKNRSGASLVLVGLAMTIGGLLTALVRGGTRGPRPPKEVINHDVMFEARDVDASVIGWIAVGIVVSAFLIYSVVRVSYSYFSRTEFRGSQPVTLVSKAPPHATSVPLLQERPEQDLERLRAAERQTLSTYGWVDQQQGIVRIPIDEAMKRVLANGLPPAEKAAPAPQNAAVGNK